MLTPKAAPRRVASIEADLVSAWDMGAAYLLTDDWQLGGRFAVAANRNSPGSVFLVELAGRF